MALLSLDKNIINILGFSIFVDATATAKEA
jgi:hypothetical protein